jgi:hypothetical protein
MLTGRIETASAFFQTLSNFSHCRRKPVAFKTSVIKIGPEGLRQLSVDAGKEQKRIDGSSLLIGSSEN